MGEISFADEIPCGDEIRLDGGWVDFFSSAKQISSEHRSDFIAPCAISLNIYDIISSINIKNEQLGTGELLIAFTSI